MFLINAFYRSQKAKEPMKIFDEIPFIDSPIEETRNTTPKSSDSPFVLDAITDSSKTGDSSTEEGPQQKEDNSSAQPLLSPAASPDLESKELKINDVTEKSKNRSDVISKTNRVDKGHPVSSPLPDTSYNHTGILKKGLDNGTEMSRASRLAAIRGKMVLNDSRQKSRDQLMSGNIFVQNAFRRETDREATLSQWKKLRSPEKDRRRSDSDVGEIIPSPTSSSRDSLEEKPTYAQSDFIYTDSHSPAGRVLAAVKGTPTSQSYPAFPHADRNERYAEKTSPQNFEGKETHFPAHGEIADFSNSYTGDVI